MSKRFPPHNLFKSVDRVILDRYLGFSFFEIDDYISLKFRSIKNSFTLKKLDEVKIIIDQKNLYNLELQRKKKFEPYNNYEQSKIFSNAEIIFKNNSYPVKLRVKGDRLLHWYKKETTSYKVDLRGPDRIWGLEEFSVQKPITRNYIYEYIFHKLLEFNNLISLKYFFVNLSINDTSQGVYAIEEGFSKELIERNKKRNGPIFGLDEEASDTSGGGIEFPYIRHDIYSKKFWISNYPKLTSHAIAKLNNFKKNTIDTDQVFDYNQWAKFFAVIDLTNAIHGVISKSVKLYYNPTTGKFEPIGFDGHYGTNNNQNFLLIDFLDKENKNCGYICHERAWILKFFKKNNQVLNNEFIELYLKELKKISSENFIKSFEEKYLDEINFYNSHIYMDNSKKDRGYFKGAGYYIYDNDYLYNRSKYINKRLSEIEQKNFLQISLNNNQIKFDNVGHNFIKKIIQKCKNNLNDFSYITKGSVIIYNKNCDYFLGDLKLSLYDNINLSDDLGENLQSQIFDFSKFNKLEKIDDKYYLYEDIIIDKNYYFPKNKQLFINQGVKINFIKDVIFVSEGSIDFNGKLDNPIEIFSKNSLGSIILYNNKYHFNNVVLNNLSFPKIKTKILYGGLNIINSKVLISNMEIKNSNSEDAINIIASDSYIDKLFMKNIKADAIDIDFGNVEFNEITCQHVQNDCFDVSGAQVSGKTLTANNINDKGISFGENSEGNIDVVNLNNNKLGIAVKDQSNLKIFLKNSKNNIIDIAVFNKKKSYGEATLELKKTNNDLEKLVVYVGENNNLITNLNLKKQIVKNSFINSILY